MGLLSCFKPKSAGTGSAPVGKRDELWRRGDFLAFTVGEDVQVAYSRDGRGARTLPSFAVEFVLGCKEFQPLEQQIAAHAAKHGWGALELEALRSWLPQIVEARLLVSSSDVRRRCEQLRDPANTPPPIGAIGFPTGGDRVALLARAVESFARNGQARGREVDLIVSDSSVRVEQRSAFRERLAELRRSCGARTLYFGEEEKRRFADGLVRRGCAREAVEFALFDPCGIGFACGANRNALLLLEAGRMFCSVDDDAVCRLAAAPETPPALSFFSGSDPFTRRLFASPERALAAADWSDANFVAAHESMLGRDVGAVLGEGDALELSLAGDELLRRLDGESARVRATFMGQAGDPGIPTSVYFLFYDGENRRRLTASEAEYRAVLASRAVLAMAATRAVGDSSISPGLAMGLDHRELLPPFFPVLHAEDFVFGATLWQCCPGSLLGHLPFAIQHEPPPGKPLLMPSDLGPERRAVVFEFAHLLRRMILGFEPAERADAASRTRSLGQYLAERAAMPPRDFEELIRRETLEHESEKIDFLEEELREDSEAPDFWRRDVESYIAHVREALAFDDFDIPFDLKGTRSAAENRALMQTLIARYAALLQEWPGMVGAARESGRDTPVAVS